MIKFTEMQKMQICGILWYISICGIKYVVYFDFGPFAFL